MSLYSFFKNMIQTTRHHKNTVTSEVYLDLTTGFYKIKDDIHNRKFYKKHVAEMTAEKDSTTVLSWDLKEKRRH